jgi:hypothetical protein
MKKAKSTAKGKSGSPKKLKQEDSSKTKQKESDDRDD